METAEQEVQSETLLCVGRQSDTSPTSSPGANQVQGWLCTDASSAFLPSAPTSLRNQEKMHLNHSLP